MLRKAFYNYEGIYIGDGGLWDDNWNINNGFGGYGSFAVFVGTNQQATLVGTDNGDGSDDGNAFGVILQFSVDRHGNWQWSGNNIDAYGSIGKVGSFWGEMDVFTNNSVLSVWLNANEQSPWVHSRNRQVITSGPLRQNLTRFWPRMGRSFPVCSIPSELSQPPADKPRLIRAITISPQI